MSVVLRARALAVSLPARNVGELGQSRSGLARWQPHETWEREGQHPRLGLDFLRQLGSRTHASALPPWFENLLPERGAPLRERLCRLHGLHDGESFALLHAVGGDLTGAVRVEAVGAVADGSEPRLVDGESPHSDGLRLQPSALAGMQLKLTMSLVRDRLHVTATRAARAYIVKFAGTEHPELAAVEHATMAWARAAGFDVPEHFVAPLSRLEGLPKGFLEHEAPAFAVRRFDRREDGSRVHQEDLCQALGLPSSDKYGDRQRRVSLEGVLRLVVDACGEDQGRELARRLGFVIASGNTDAHLKNWSLVWGERTRPVLSPCYDWVSTIAWDAYGWQSRGGPSLALALGGTRAFRLIDERTLRSFEEHSGVASGWARAELLAGVDRARAAWEQARPLAHERMVVALRTHWDSVPLLRSGGPLERGA